MAMNKPEIKFDNGATYDYYMGVWSRLVGNAFLDWLAAPAGLRWLDVGCGNAAFTRLLAGRSQPASLDGVDPSAAMLDFARSVPELATAHFRQGNAMALPYPAHSYDAAVMPLVIFFVPEPARGVAEMARVVRPGGLVTAYGWDMVGGGFPYHAVRDELEDMGARAPEEPSRDASRPDVLLNLWKTAGLTDIEPHTFTVARTYPDFDDYWTTVLTGPATSSILRSMETDQLAQLRERLQKRLPPDSKGRITCRARANAISGRVPG
jgi:SAM-dependent methyltransferase